tara:strand:- start:253 stop:444 length:192 start_codon:yes stop_codon:yes gene_type:complete
MDKKIKTPLTELIKQFESELEHENTRQGLKYAIALAKRMLKREKEIMCWFADEWHEMKLKKNF